jgi:hypothetical protein
VVDVSVNSTALVNSNEEIVEKTENRLKNYNGKNLVFVNEAKLIEEIESESPYIKVIDVEKKFPNKISVTVEERKECYSVAVDGSYYILDSEFYCVAKRNENVSNVEGAKNVNINLNVSDYSVNALIVGKQFALTDEVTVSYLKTLTPYIVNNVANINSVTIKVKENSYYNRQFTLEMVEGVNFILDKADVNTVEKFNFAYSYYLQMPNKSYSVLTVTVSDDTGEFIVC